MSVGLGIELPFDREFVNYVWFDALTNYISFAGYDPSAHVNDDFFANKLAFVVLLNFPLTTLDQRESLFAHAGADAMLVFRFGAELADAITAAQRPGSAGSAW